MTNLDIPELPSLPGSRRWQQRPGRIGDIGLDDRGDQWLWIPTGLLWVEPGSEAYLSKEPDDEDFLDSIRQIARST